LNLHKCFVIHHLSKPSAIWQTNCPYEKVQDPAVFGGSE
jgi:hypothetical protein